jgi:hypothetical protein
MTDRQDLRNTYPFHNGSCDMSKPYNPWEVRPSREEQISEKWFLIGWSAGTLTCTVVVLIALHFLR